MDAGVALVLVALVGTVNVLVTVIGGGLFTLAVARLNHNVKAVHVAVNSERSKMVDEVARLIAENNQLIGANVERKHVADEAASFEAGRATGAAVQAPDTQKVEVVNAEPVKVAVVDKE